ncbi:MAG: hypothetical protein IPJ82_24790 [Lewinellaceae bacterium]|nr:hypothetical protein [Lewinellaceae bacterium]
MWYKALLLLTLYLLPAVLPAQSPWTRSKAGFYTQAAWHFIPAYTSLFSPLEGIINPGPFDFPLDRELSESTFQLYGEYGITKKTTLVASLPFRFLKAGRFLGNFATPETQEGSLSGLGNVSLGVRRAILEGNVRLTGSIRIDLPVDRYDDATGLSTGYKAWTILPMLSTGMGFRRSYWFGYAGYGIRTNDFSHYMDLGIEGGFRIKKVWLIGFSEWLHSFKNGDVALPFRNRLTGLYVNDQAWLSLGFKGIVEFNRFWGVFLSAAGAADGQWVPKRPGFGAGCYFKWD